MKRILLVDDEPSLLRVYKRALTEAGYHVDEVDDGHRALQLARRGEHDIVISDISLPGISGVDLLRTIHAHDPEAPVILMTGQPAIETAVQAVELGALRYLMKPFPISELLEAVSKAGRLRELVMLKRAAQQLSGFVTLTPEMRALQNLRLDGALEGMWMAYQPVIRAYDKTTYAHEALLRTREPSFPNPGVLLEVCEQLDRLHDLGRAVRRSVAQVASAQPERTFFVNLHPSDLFDENLYSLSAPLTHCAPAVVLEITERATLDDIPDVRGRIARLRALGYRIALDDLGAGYAGLSSLAHLDPEIIKLDMSLIRNAHHDETKKRLLNAMIALVHDLGKLVVGEGVECVEEQDLLVNAGCDFLQGYLFARPTAELVDLA